MWGAKGVFNRAGKHFISVENEQLKGCSDVRFGPWRAFAFAGCRAPAGRSGDMRRRHRRAGLTLFLSLLNGRAGDCGLSGSQLMRPAKSGRRDGYGANRIRAFH
jgi:hypothetical protein